MNLVHIRKAAFTEHTVHDARHRVQVVNDQHRIDVVDQGKAPPSGHARDWHAATRINCITRRPSILNLHDSFAYKDGPRRREAVNFIARDLKSGTYAFAATKRIMLSVPRPCCVPPLRT